MCLVCRANVANVKSKLRIIKINSKTSLANASELKYKHSSKTLVKQFLARINQSTSIALEMLIAF